MRLPNSLPYTKDEYIREVMTRDAMSLLNAPRIVDASLLCYHMEVPIDDAKAYIQTLNRKLNLSGVIYPKNVKGR